jgi:hypothetical protein
MRSGGKGLLAALLVMWSGAGCSGGEPSCAVEQFVDAAVQGQNPTDCGTFELGSALYTDEAMHAAQLCVLNAIARGSAFRLVYDAAQPGIKGAFSGRAGGTQLRSYAAEGRFGDAGSDFTPQASGRSCERVVETPSCSPKVGLPCLTCENPGQASLLCTG